MVQKVTNEEIKELLALLNKDKIINCYMISDIETLGLNHPSIDLYAQIEDQKIVSVLMFFNRYAIFYTETTIIEQELIDIIKSKKPFSLSGGKQSITIFSKYIKSKKMESFELSVLKKKESNPFKKSNFSIIELESESQLEDLYDMLKHIKEFNVSSQTKEEFIEEKKLINKAGCSYGMYLHNELCCTASTLTETTHYAVINGVATKKEHRKKGYASILIDHVIHEYITKKNKELILYYNNKDAANIYLRKGFKPHDVWVSLKELEF